MKINFIDSFNANSDIFSGVYEMHIDGQVYVGQSSNIFRRLTLHRSKLRAGKSDFKSSYNINSESKYFIIIHKMLNSLYKQRILKECELTKKYMMAGISLNIEIGDNRKAKFKKIVGTNINTLEEIEFNSINEARDYLKLKSASSISNVLKGKAKTANKFNFKYK